MGGDNVFRQGGDHRHSGADRGLIAEAAAANQTPERGKVLGQRSLVGSDGGIAPIQRQ